MAAVKDTAQVLRLFEHSNSSLIVVMLGRALGQFRMLAKGIQRWTPKGFEGGLDLLSRGEILVYPRPGDSLWIFSAWDEHPKPPLPATEEGLAAASYLCEFTEALTRQMAGALIAADGEAPADDSKARLYDLLSKAADALATGSPAGPVVLAYTTKALEIEGVLPGLVSCHRCSRRLLDENASETVWLSFDGLTCQACHGTGRATPPGKLREAERRALEQGVWLTPEAHEALFLLHAASRVPRIGAGDAELLARGLAAAGPRRAGT